MSFRKELSQMFLEWQLLEALPRGSGIIEHTGGLQLYFVLLMGAGRRKIESARMKPMATRHETNMISALIYEFWVSVVQYRREWPSVKAVADTRSSSNTDQRHNKDDDESRWQQLRST